MLPLTSRKQPDAPVVPINKLPSVVNLPASLPLATNVIIGSIVLTTVSPL